MNFIKAYIEMRNRAQKKSNFSGAKKRNKESWGVIKRNRLRFLKRLKKRNKVLKKRVRF